LTISLLFLHFLFYYLLSSATASVICTLFICETIRNNSGFVPSDSDMT
jgi:hypothetical protein